MNKTAIRNFAVWARNKLIADVSYHAGLLGITKNGISKALPQSTKGVEFYDIGTAEPYAIRGEEIRQRKSLVDAICAKEKDSIYETAYSSLMEEVAYTWFNRLIAVRFMEVNDYLPEHVRVLSSESGKQEPDLVTTPFDAELFFAEGEQQKIVQMKNDNKLDEVFSILFIKQCRELSRILPRLFERTNDYTELLLSLSFIDQEGVVYHLVHDISEDDFNIEKGGQVEIIGWLYQYYNAELKDETFALLKNNVKVTKERIPFATQLFTPDWIVRYMVENSLGRLWVEGHPNDILKSGWKYYLDEAEQEASVKAELEKIRLEYAKLNLEDIKVIDPCMGSGHILVYAFDVLMQIYESAGYTQRDASKSIMEHNLFGLDIDDRAAQLAYFAVMMKARQYNRRILDGVSDCNIYAIKESNNFDRGALIKLGDDLRAVAEKLLDTFVDAKEYGSIITVDVTLDELDALDKRLNDIDQMSDYGNLQDMMYAGILCKEFEPLIRQARVMVDKYDVVVTNPPYLANGNMGKKMLDYVKERFAVEKSDLFAVFVSRCIQMSKNNRYQAFMTSYTWMYIATYEAFRKKLFDNCSIITLVQPEYHAFFESANVPICSFVTHNNLLDENGNYIKLSDFYGADIQSEKLLEAINDDNCSYRYVSNAESFERIPGTPVAYWISPKMIDAFQIGKGIGDIAKPKQGLATADNNRFIRLWQEVDIRNTCFECENIEMSVSKGVKWFPYNKGGDYRKWFGNNDYLVNWYNDGEEIRNFKDEKGKVKSRPQNTQYYFKECISWSLISSSSPAFRYKPNGFIFDVAGMSCFSDTDLKYLLALCNTKLVTQILRILAPTINYQVGDIANIPVIDDDEKREEIEAIADQCIDLSKKDWDSFETSWDFKRHPLI